MTTRNAGDEGLVWRIGIVVDLDDPLKLGRVRAQSISDQDALDKDQLPWAHILLPSTSASSGGVGLSPTGIDIESHVLMIYLDGAEKQKPVIIGTFAKIPDMDINKHDVNIQARNQDNLKRSPLGPEPSSPYNSEYPYNKVYSTKSGHTIEIDDTPGAERINIYHMSGSYIELDGKGNRTDKIMNKHVDVTVSGKTIYVKGDCIIQSESRVSIEAPDISIKGNVYISGGSLTHDGKNIGKDHTHLGIQPGSGKSGVPV